MFGLGLGDLDVVAMDAVVADLEVGDTGGLALALFQIHQKLVGIAGQPAELVQFLVIAVPQNAPVANDHRGVVHQGATEQQPFLLVGIRGRAQFAKPFGPCVMQRLVEGRQPLQCVAKSGEVPRAGGAHCDPGQDALAIGQAPQDLAQRLGKAFADQAFNGILPR